MARQVQTDGRCPICEKNQYIPRFQVPFPYHSACGQGGFPLEKVLEVPTWTIVECLECSVQYPHPYPSREQIDDYYSSQAEPGAWEKKFYVEVRPEVRDRWRHFAQKLSRLRGQPGRLLEIGCAAGWLLKGARDVGWSVSGIEASPKFQRYAKDTLELPVKLGTIDRLKEMQSNSKDNGEKFDVVVMTDVIEHLHDPIHDLQTIRSAMNDDGYLVLATCDIGSFGARFYGRDWRQVVVSHTIYWTKKSMKVALERAGFRLEHLSEVRYWDPDLKQERRLKAQELAKLWARLFLFHSYIPVAKRVPAIQKLPSFLSRNRLNHEDVMFKVGDQPTLGDVMLVVARPVK